MYRAYSLFKFLKTCRFYLSDSSNSDDDGFDFIKKQTITILDEEVVEEKPTVKSEVASLGMEK